MGQTLRIAIDGPAAAGKSTVAKTIAKELSLVYVDTGAMYRAFTLKALEQQIKLDEVDTLLQLLKNTSIQLVKNGSSQDVLLDHRNVTKEIRSNEVSNAVSKIAQYPLIRKEMVKRQQKLADNVNVVMDGRDIGTHVLPDAEVKVFLIASVEERAKRRFQENKRKGFNPDLSVLTKEIKDRDELDMNRATSPLIQADDAIAIDTTALSINEVVEKILGYVKMNQDKK